MTDVKKIDDDWKDAPQRKRRGRANRLSEAASSLDADTVAKLFSSESLTPVTVGGKKMWACPIEECGKAFERRYDLDRHSWIHRTDRPFVCSVKQCKKSFIRKDYLKKHMRKEHKDVLLSESEDEVKPEPVRKRRKGKKTRYVSSSEEEIDVDNDSQKEEEAVNILASMAGWETGSSKEGSVKGREASNTSTLVHASPPDSQIVTPVAPKKRGRKKKVVDDHQEVKETPLPPSHDDSDNDDFMNPPRPPLPTLNVVASQTTETQSSQPMHTPPSSPPSHDLGHQPVMKLFSTQSTSATKYEHQYLRTPNSRKGYQVAVSHTPTTPLEIGDFDDTHGKIAKFTIPREPGETVRIDRHHFSSRSSTSTLVSNDSPLAPHGILSVSSTSSDGSQSLRPEGSRRKLFVENDELERTLVQQKFLHEQAFKLSRKDEMGTLVEPKALEKVGDAVSDAELLQNFSQSPPRPTLPLASFKTPKAPPPATHADSMSPEFYSYIKSNPSTPSL